MALGKIEAGKNVKFLLGTQDNLEGYISGSKQAEHGAFYLTDDTHRLYVGTKDKKVVPVNEGVIKVDSVDKLPSTNVHPGEFYYAEAENILCIYSGPYNQQTGKGGWVQINSNTNTYLVEGDTEITPVNVNTAKFSQTFIDNDGNMPIIDEFNIEVADGIKLAISEDKKTLVLTGVLNKQFNTSASSNVATVELEDTFGNKAAKFNIQAKSGSNLTVDVATDGAIELDVNNMYNTGVAVTNYDIDGDKKSGFSIDVADKNGIVSGDFDPIIKVGHDASKQKSIKFSKGEAHLPVYTKEEIDDIKLALNSMTYRGLVGKDKTSTQEAWSTVYRSNTIAVGDTYLFAEETTYTPTGGQSSVTVSKGTLAIARGQEGSNGYIPANSIQWDFVESTVDTDTKYKFDAQPSTATASGYVELDAIIGGGVSHGERITFTSGTAIDAVVNVDNTTGNATVIFNHEGITATDAGPGTINQGKAGYQSSSSSAIAETQMTVLEGITVNGQGHVTGFKTNTVTLRDTNATVNLLKTSIGTSTTATQAILTDHIQLIDGTGGLMEEKTSNWAINSSTLTFSRTDESNLNVDLVWGSF